MEQNLLLVYLEKTLKMKKISSFLGLLFVTLGFNACFQDPDYPEIPAIGFKKITNTPSNTADSLVVTISFRDGNGDLGLGANENTPPYSESINGKPNPFYYNYFITPYKKQRGILVPIQFIEGVNLNGRYPDLNPKRKTTSLEGELSYSFVFFYTFSSSYSPAVRRGDTLLFDIQIADRSRNLSNTIRTDEIIVGKLQ